MDPKVEKYRKMLLNMDYLEKFGPRPQSKCFPSGEDEDTFEGSRWSREKFVSLGSRQGLLDEFIAKREKEKEEFRALKKHKKEQKMIRREKKELKKKKMELKLKRKEKEPKLVKGEEELNKVKRAETTKIDDGVPMKKLKLVKADDEHANEETNLDIASLEDKDHLRQGVSPYKQDGNMMNEGLKLCTKEAKKKTVAHTKDV